MSELLDGLKWVSRLSEANPTDKIRIMKLHDEIFGNSISVCVNCPDSLRAAVNRLKVEYEQRTKR